MIHINYKTGNMTVDFEKFMNKMPIKNFNKLLALIFEDDENLAYNLINMQDVLRRMKKQAKSDGNIMIYKRCCKALSMIASTEGGCVRGYTEK